MSLKSHRQYVQEQAENEEFAREYDQAQAQARFAVELALARERLGLTQEQVAQKAQIKQPMLARYERGQLPSTPTLMRLSRALDAEITFAGGMVTIRTRSARSRSGSGSRRAPARAAARSGAKRTSGSAA